jgi:ABC-type dipeptide/oligopeptide/nickel transport system permease subunit
MTVIAIPLGVLAAYRQNSWIDQCSRLLSLMGVVTPAFLLAILFQLLASIELIDLPVLERLDADLAFDADVTGLILVDSILAGRGDVFLGGFQHLLLPSIALSALFAPWMSPYADQVGSYVNFRARHLAPSSEYWFGTDNVGRDIFTRVIFGYQVSLKLVFGVLGIAIPIGATLSFFGWGFSLLHRISEPWWLQVQNTCRNTGGKHCFPVPPYCMPFSVLTSWAMVSGICWMWMCNDGE